MINARRVGSILILVIFCFLPLQIAEGRQGMKDAEMNEKDVSPGACGFVPGEEELKKILKPEQYRITREAGTEPPFLNEYWNNKRQGIYVDIITGKPLFSSKDKFDSGTGWPSFIAPIDEDNLDFKADTSHGVPRIEVRAKESNSHLGHVFDDGPAPTYKRYCINSAALRFIPAEDLKKEGYSEYAYLFKSPAKNTAEPATQFAIFAAGCFWGVEDAFRKVDGVVDTTVGYSGGTKKNPAYLEVCSGKTAHAESVRVEFDPKKVSYEKLLDVFFSIHNPTTLNRQGPDTGSQYRSVIFYHNPEQEALARKYKEALGKSGRFKGKIVTEIVKAKDFFKAEEYHQRYYEKHGISSPVCQTAAK